MCEVLVKLLVLFGLYERPLGIILASHNAKSSAVRMAPPRLLLAWFWDRFACYVTR